MIKKIIPLLMTFSVYAGQPRTAGDVTGTLPWLTGPLLTPSGHVVPVGHYNIEPYFYATNIVGSYDRHWQAHSLPSAWKNNLQIPVQIGITDTIDFAFTPQGFYNYTRDAHTFNLGDLSLEIDYQLYKNETTTWTPALKLSLEETFPTGRYQRLNPAKRGTDAIGLGAYTTTVGLTFSALKHVIRKHYLSLRASASYSMAPPVHVTRLNSYGGDKTTKGKVRPGNSLATLVGLEFSLNHNWVLAFDAMNAYTNKTHFSGKTTAPVGSASSNQISFAPAIEYNFNQKAGLIAGVWFSAFGRNSSDFVSYVIAYNYYGSSKKHGLEPFHPHGGRGGSGGAGGGGHGGGHGGAK